MIFTLIAFVLKIIGFKNFILLGIGLDMVNLIWIVIMYWFCGVSDTNKRKLI